MSLQSDLFSLTPIGIGTSMTESLTSYLQRLAESHSVLIKDLIKHEIAPLLKREYLNKTGARGANRFYEYVGTLNGII